MTTPSQNLDRAQTASTLMDCTLRDSSYSINFQFSERDTRNIARGLDEAGVKYIEIGHGLGLGASSPEFGMAFETDEAYIAAARQSVLSSKIGAFFITGIGNHDDLNIAADNGLDFVRVGNNVTEFEESEDDIAAALNLGLEVHLNLMKTYALGVEEFARKLEITRGWGLSSVYIVDSAGYMLPQNVTDYTHAASEACDTSIGFHGHNNLNLANANSLSALDAGAEFVDGTLRGMGRSSGNAQTEVLASLLPRSGYKIHVDISKLFEVSEHFLVPLMVKKQGDDPLDIVIGMSKFHTAYLPLFRRVVNKFDVNLYRLIETVSEINCVDPTEELITEVARDLNRTDG